MDVFWHAFPVNALSKILFEIRGIKLYYSWERQFTSRVYNTNNLMGQKYRYMHNQEGEEKNNNKLNMNSLMVSHK